MIAKELLKALDIVVELVGFCAVDDIVIMLIKFIMMVRMSIQKIIIKI